MSRRADEMGKDSLVPKRLKALWKKHGGIIVVAILAFLVGKLIMPLVMR